jgi:hypothetical protein
MAGNHGPRCSLRRGRATCRHGHGDARDGSVRTDRQRRPDRGWGRVSTESAWDSGHRNIYSTIDINVQESWKGATPGDGRIRIRQLGGAVGDIEMTVFGMARFTPGERALLFLRQARVVGMGQGKRLVHWDSADKRWLADAPDRSHVLGVDGQGRPRAAESNQPEALDRLRERVRALIGN